MKRSLSILAVVFIASRSTLEANPRLDAASIGTLSPGANSIKELTPIYLRLRMALTGGIPASYLLVITFLAGSWCQSALAQDGTSHIKLPVEAVPGDPSAPPRQIQPGSLLLRLPPLIPDLTQSSGHISQFRSNELPAGKEPQFIVTNGAAYIYIPGPAELIGIPIDISGGKLISIPTDISGYLIPLAGGGQSGCLGMDSDGSAVRVTTSPASPPYDFRRCISPALHQ
jgi:hypothetical protein